MLAGVASAADLYVATNGNDSTHSSWSTAYTNVQDALNAAGNGDTIYLAGHSFALTNQLVWTGKTNVAIRGGYAATNDADQPGPFDSRLWPTVFSRTPSYTGRILNVTSISTGTLERITVAGGNLTAAGSTYGGGVYLSACTGILFSACTILSNALVNTTQSSGTGYGGGLYSASSIVTLSNCMVRANSNNGGNARGGGIYVSGGTMSLRDSVIVNNASVSSYDMQGGGIYNAGTCVMRNCLVAGNVAPDFGDGLYLAGNTRLENCTLANNAGQGIYRSSGAVVVTNSIIWGNVSDILGSVTVSWSDSGNGITPGVNGCLSVDPTFERGYYLATNSLCIDAGTNSAAVWELTNRTTRTDGSIDGGQVDMGYHYPAGYDFSYGDLYVATNGNNTLNSGTNPASPFRTITKAISVVRDGSVIHVGAGSYTNGSESFPLMMVDLMGIQILGTDAATTVIDAQGSANRAMTVSGCNNTTLSGVTITRGNITTAGNTYGGGVRVSNCGGILLSSCVIASNTLVNTTQASGTGFGAGLYSANSSVTMSNCLVNANLNNGGNAWGGGIHINDGSLTLRNSIVANNSSVTSYDRYGGGIYNNAGTCVMRNCLVTGNVAPGAGDGLYLAGNTCLENCTVANNAGQGIYRSSGAVVVTNSIIWGNVSDILGSVTVSWSDSGNGVTNGVNGCLSADPAFERGYYLASGSPCVDAGTNEASYWSLSGFTTRTDSSNDSGRVDMGYHYPTGYSSSYADIYVAMNGDDGNGGTNAAAPFRTITKALSIAQNGTRVHVVSGSYTNGSETFPLTATTLSGVQILGTNCVTTTISAGGSNRRVMTLNACNNMVVSGVTITGGNVTTNGNTYGGGVYLSSCSGITFTDCAITNNKLVNTTQASGTGYGAGLYAAGSSVTLSNCLVKANANNGGNAWGGGICVTDGSLTLRNSVVAGNTCVTTYNRYGGGIYNNGGICRLRNCLVTENVSQNGSGLMGAFTVENGTVANNSNQGINGSGAMTNSIVWGNGDDVVGAVVLAYSDIEDGDNNTTNGCISVDPLFVNTNAADYRLTKFSSCVNAGINQAWMVNALDLDGNPRIKSGKVDMGAYECQSVGGTMFVIR
jgi:hypothetical protein